MTKTRIAAFFLAAAAALTVASPADAQTSQAETSQVQTSQAQTTTATNVNGLQVSGVAEQINFSDPNHKGLGDKLRYDFTLTNTRTIPMYYYVVSGNFDGWDLFIKPSGNCPKNQQTLPAGAKFTCWAEHTITQKDLDAGFYKPDSSWRGMTAGTARVGFVEGTPVRVR